MSRSTDPTLGNGAPGPEGPGTGAAGGGIRVLVVGDSVAAGMGMGERGSRFGRVAAAALNAEAVLDLSRPSRTTAEAVELLEQMRAFRPTVAFVCCGGTEALVHPGAGVQRIIERFAPASWHGVAGLHPRPSYSRRPLRRFRQRASSLTKLVLKHALVRATRARSRVPPEEFGASLLALLEGLDALRCRSYVLTLCHADERLFPRCTATFAATNAEIHRAVGRAELAQVVSIREEMHYWDDFLADHAHWSVSGHQRAASSLVAAVRADLAATTAHLAATTTDLAATTAELG